MTKVGSQLVDEFVNETLEKIENDRSRIFVAQSASTVKRIILYSLSLFFLALLASLLLFLIIINLSVEPETIALLREANNHEIVNVINQSWRIIITLTVVLGFAISLFFVLISRGFAGSKMGQRPEHDQQEVNLVNRVVEIQEELLIRHGLIKVARDHD